MLTPTAVDYFISAASALEQRVLVPYLTPLQNSFTTLCHTYAPQVTSTFQQYLAKSRSVHAETLPLMNGFHVAAIIVAYLAIVLGGKQIMSMFNSKLDVKLFANVHNAFCVWLSGYTCFYILYEAFVRSNYTLFTNPLDETPKGQHMAKITWLFFFSKIIEFTDTFIMVMKKNFRQISFLHVYHHSSILAIWWITTLIANTGESYFSIALNSFIHVVMYSYYLLSSLGVKQVSFIKPYITIGQMTQFALLMTQASYDIFDYYYLSTPKQRQTKYPIELTILLWVYMWTMLGLFANFFVKSYTGKSAKSGVKSSKTSKKIQ